METSPPGGRRFSLSATRIRPVPGAVTGLASAAVLLTLLVPCSAVAQDRPDTLRTETPDSVVLRGWVLDGPSDQPLSDAYVAALELEASTVTGEDGAFRLSLPGAAAYRLRVGRFGYEMMDFRVTVDMAGKPLELNLQAAPLAVEGVEITVDRLAELERRLDQRARTYAAGAVRSVDAEEIRSGDFATALEVVLSRGGGMLFECIGSGGTLCARARPTGSLLNNPRDRPTEVPVPVCVDEGRAWGAVGYLRSIPADEVQRIEFYGFGGRGQVRVYTRWFMMRKSADRRALHPVEWGC